MGDLDARLGRFVTLQVAEGDQPTTAAVSAVSRVEVCLTLTGRRVPSAPVAGDRILCTSAAGHWDARVLGVDGGAITLRAPSWLTRAAARRAVRVPTSVAVSVEASDRALAGRIRDLSVSGAALVVEASLAPRLASEVYVDLPSGLSRAMVRSRRSHGHPLLKVLGLEWEEPDGATQRWLRTQVGRATLG